VVRWVPKQVPNDWRFHDANILSQPDRAGGCTGVSGTQLLTGDEELKKHWEAVFDPITLLVGKADDLTVRDFAEYFGHLLESRVLHRLDDEGLKRVLELAKAGAGTENQSGRHFFCATVCFFLTFGFQPAK